MINIKSRAEGKNDPTQTPGALHSPYLWIQSALPQHEHVFDFQLENYLYFLVQENARNTHTSTLREQNWMINYIKCNWIIQKDIIHQVSNLAICKQ